MKFRKLLIIFLVLILTFGLTACNNQKEKEELEMAYIEQNKAFGLSNNSNEYMPHLFAHFNPEGIRNDLYLKLAFYKKETGNNIDYSQIEDYLSQEFEDDDEVRIYTNGRHPEIATYIEWACEHLEELKEYEDTIWSIYAAYKREHLSQGFDGAPLYDWSTETVDELIKKEADPDYELDLMAIQQREKENA